jgi:hypothetical protein
MHGSIAAKMKLQHPAGGHPVASTAAKCPHRPSDVGAMVSTGRLNEWPSHDASHWSGTKSEKKFGRRLRKRMEKVLNRLR